MRGSIAMTAVVFMLSVLSLQLRSGKVQGGSRPSPTISMIHMTHNIKNYAIEGRCPVRPVRPESTLRVILSDRRESKDPFSLRCKAPRRLWRQEGGFFGFAAKAASLRMTRLESLSRRNNEQLRRRRVVGGSRPSPTMGMTHKPQKKTMQ